MGRWMEEREKGIKTLIGGDFNERTGEEGGWEEESNQEENGKGRKSKDKKLMFPCKKPFMTRFIGIFHLP